MSRNLDRNPPFDCVKLVSFSRGDASDRATGSFNQSPTLVGNAAVSGGVLVLDGTGDTVTFPDASFLSFTDGSGTDLPFSVSCWINQNTVGSAYRSAVAKASTAGSSREWVFYASANFSTIKGPCLYLVTSSSGATLTRGQAANTMSGSTWYHVAATYSGSETAGGIKVFINGVQSDDTTLTTGSYTGMANTTTVMSIGAYADASQAFAGSMDEVRVYNRELTAAEVAAIYSSGRP